MDRRLPEKTKPMSRTPFILGTTAVCVAVTLVAIRLTPTSHPAPLQTPRGQAASGFPARSADIPKQEGTGLPTNRPHRPADEGFDTGVKLHHSVSIPPDRSRQEEVSRILARTEMRSQETLAGLTEQYALTRKQRAAIYPLIVAHDRDAHPAMLVAGSALPVVPAGSSLDESIYPLLNDEQRELLEEKALDHDAWWSEIASQLQDDLSGAMDSAEVTLPQPDATPPGATVPSSGPAPGDGAASTHDGGNLFDLLKGN